MKKNLLILIKSIIVVFTLFNIVNNKVNNKQNNNTKASKNKTRVLHIGVDGFTKCNTNLESIYNSTLLREMKQNGSWTHSHLSTINGFSLHGWCEQLCGVDAVALGITDQEKFKPAFLSDDPLLHNITSVYNNKPSYKCLFQKIKEYNSNLKTYLITSFHRLSALLGYNIFPDSLDYEFFAGYDVKHITPILSLSDQIFQKVDNIVSNDDFDYMFVFNSDADDFGHNKGFCTKEYNDNVDRLLFKIEQWINILKKRDMWEDTVIIISSDHGAEIKGHNIVDGIQLSNMSLKNPFYIMGKGIKKNYEIKTKNFRMYDVPFIISKLLNIEPDNEWMGIGLDEIFK